MGKGCSKLTKKVRRRRAQRKKKQRMKRRMLQVKELRANKKKG